MFPGKYHQNGGFSMAMLFSGRVRTAKFQWFLLPWDFFNVQVASQKLAFATPQDSGNLLGSAKLKM